MSNTTMTDVADKLITNSSSGVTAVHDDAVNVVSTLYADGKTGLDGLYQTFINQVLPAMGEGLTITKDYFTDLFGRYVSYLILIDSAALVVGIALLLCSIPLVKHTIAYARNEEEMGLLTGFFALLMILIGFVMTLTNFNNLAKDLLIPEVRVIEEIKSKVDQNR